NRHKIKLSKAQKEICEYFAEGLLELTPTEKMIYGFYVEGKTTAEIRAKLNITENTLKYHNKNIYSKLGVSSRKELMEVAKLINRLSE
ncbi:MAG: helix-turn-helix transcriptional regulator, partial [Oscillospiraceae bacterium]|nr:helix-turn-helix transcriptional regulator [Oscillospiraceae bacterium]